MHNVAEKQNETLFRQELGVGERRVVVELSVMPTHSLQLSLTSETDPMFLYTSRISMADFERIKEEQSLLIDYSTFPSTFVELLNRCHEEKFRLELNKRTDTLDVIEINSFKHLVHLCIPVTAGSDKEVMAHMADVIRSLKESLNRVKRNSDIQLNEMKNSLSMCQKNLDDRIETSRELEMENEARLRKIIEAHDTDMNREKQKMAEIKDLYESRLEADRVELDRRYRNEIRELSLRLENLSAEKNAIEMQYGLKETSERELIAKMCAMKDEMGELRRKSRYDDEEYRAEQERLMNEERRRFERQLEDINARSKREREVIVDDKERLSISLREKTFEIKNLKISVRNLTLELTKANEIIKRLYDDAVKAEKQRRDGACQTPGRLRRIPQPVSFKDQMLVKPIRRWPDVHIGTNE